MNLEKLKIKIILSQPFFGSLLHKMEHVLVDDMFFTRMGKEPTAATDGNTIFFSEKWMDSLSSEEQLFVCCHEILHAAFLHVQRYTKLYNLTDKKEKEDATLFNIAADLLINDLLVNQMSMRMPKDEEGRVIGLISNEFKFDEWTVEKLYNHLKQNAKKVEGIIKSGGGGGEDMLPGKDKKTQAEEQREAEEWKIAINSAAQLTQKTKGNLPSSLQRLIDQLLKPKVDWKKELYDWLSAKIFTEATWNKCNKRFVHQELYLPAKYSEGCGEIVIGIDTSGSIGEPELTAFASELNYILEFVKPIKVTVIYCDAAVNKVKEFTMEDLPIKFEAVGGGGTDFRPVFNWVAKNRKDVEIAGLIYMTDMYGAFPDKEPSYPTAWMATSKVKPPFGKYIEYLFGENK